MNGNHPQDAMAAVVSGRRAHGQLILCQGCCCGRTDRGFPAVPVDRLKAAWKAARLNRTIQLTVSGCVGPCDVANVAVVVTPVTPAGTIWLGGLGDPAHYDALLHWAEACQQAGSVMPLPPALGAHRFRWFLDEPQDAIVPACARGDAAVPAVREPAP